MNNGKTTFVQLVAVLAALGSTVVADTITLEASDDSWVNGNTASKDTNYGTENKTVIRYQNATWGFNYSLYKFDTSALPSNIEVNSVRMRFYTALGNWPGPTNFAPVAIFNNTQDWSEMNVTFNTAPTYDTTATETLDYLGANWDPVYFTGTNTISASGWLEFQGAGTMALVQGWADGTIDNFGISMMGTGDYVSDSRTFQPQTKEHASPVLWPEIIVNYTLTSFSGYAGWADGWGGVEIGAETNDFDGDGLLNIEEYALGGDPTNELDQGTAPTFGIVEEGSTNWFGYIHPQVAEPGSGLAYSLETCTNLVLGTWTNDGYAVEGTNVTGGTLDFVTNSTDTVDNEKFMRLAIVHEPSFNVMDFGAKGDGVADDTAAIFSALLTADAWPDPAEVDLPEVYLPEGIYRISSPDNFALLLDGFSDVRLRGAGSNTVLLVSNPWNGAVGVYSSTNIVLKDFTVDYDPLPFTQGTIVAVDTNEGTYDLEIDEGYPELDEPWFSTADMKWGIRIDPALQAYDLWAHFSSNWVSLGSSTWRMHEDDPSYLAAHPLSVGERYVHLARMWTAYGILVTLSSNVEIDSVTFHASCGPTTGWINGEGYVVQKLRVEKKPGSSRLISSNGGGVLCGGCSDGVLFSECYFDAMPDDGINIHGRSGYVVENISDTVKEVGLNGGQDGATVFKPGDELLFRRQGVPGIYTNAVVANVLSLTGTRAELELDRPLPGLLTGKGDGDKVSNLSRCGQGSIIENSFFGAHRGRDILLSSYDVNVTGNHFYNPSFIWTAVALLNDHALYTAGPSPFNIDIVGNTFECEGNEWSWGYPSIFLFSRTAPGVESTAYDIYNVRVESNQFINIDGAALSATSARDVQFLNNTVDVDMGVKTEDAPTVYISHATAIQIDELDIHDLNPETYAAIHIKGNVPGGSEGVTISSLNAVLAPGSVEVQDER